MSDDNKPNELQTVDTPVSDFTSKDLEVIKKYEEAGLPGLLTVDEVKLARIMDMYLSGKTYRQIAMTMATQKQIVLYLSHKFNWFQLRNEYIEDLEANMRNRVMEDRIVNKDFLLQLQHVWRKKISNKMDKYLATGNEEFLNEIDLKEVNHLLKTIETMNKMTAEKAAAGQGTPSVGLNLGDGVTVVRKSDTEVEITPKSKAIGDMITQYANLRREEENKSKNKL
jgi:hypothetical protein